MALAMFSENRGTQNSGHLVEFKAGKCVLKPHPGGDVEKQVVSALPAKGLIFLKQTADMLMHFCWKNRETGSIDDDLIVFPGDTTFVPVTECPNGRVFMLKFKNTERRFTFWMQDANADKDADLMRRAEDFLNGNATAGGGATSRGAAGQQLADLSRSFGLGSAPPGDLSAVNNMDHGQLMQFLNLMGGSGGGGGVDMNSAASLLGALGATPGAEHLNAPPSSRQQRERSTAPATGGEAPSADGQSAPSTTLSNAVVQLSDLQGILANMNLPAPAERQSPVDLEEVLSGANVASSAAGNADQLLPHLPDEAPADRSVSQLSDTVHSPQYRQAVGLFGAALQTGELGPLLSQMGVPANAVDAASRGDVGAFARELQGTTADGQGSSEAADSTDAPGSGNAAKKDEPEDGQNMDLD